MKWRLKLGHTFSAPPCIHPSVARSARLPLTFGSEPTCRAFPNPVRPLIPRRYPPKPVPQPSPSVLTPPSSLSLLSNHGVAASASRNPPAGRPRFAPPTRIRRPPDRPTPHRGGRKDVVPDPAAVSPLCVSSTSQLPAARVVANFSPVRPVPPPVPPRICACRGTPLVRPPPPLVRASVVFASPNSVVRLASASCSHLLRIARSQQIGSLTPRPRPPSPPPSTWRTVLDAAVDVDPRHHRRRRLHRPGHCRRRRSKVQHPQRQPSTARSHVVSQSSWRRQDRITMKAWSKTCSFLTPRGHHTRNLSEDAKIDSDAKDGLAMQRRLKGKTISFRIMSLVV